MIDVKGLPDENLWRVTIFTSVIRTSYDKGDQWSRSFSAHTRAP